MKKTVFYTEFAYVAAMLLMALSVALTEKCDLGLSMVEAPSYSVYLFISRFLPFVTFGMTEYCVQGVLLCILALVVRRFKVGYLLSFVTAVLFGLCLDFFRLLVTDLPVDTLPLRILWFALGSLICTAGVAFQFKSYLAPQVYELFVMEISDRFGKDIHKVKTVYDLSSLAVAVVLNFLFFGGLVGVGVGTVVVALVNGFVIGLFSKLYDKVFVFRDALSWRPFFEGKKK